MTTAVFGSHDNKTDWSLILSSPSKKTELRACPDCDDLLFFNERGELTESSIANVVVEVEGKLVTPPVSAGLLAGTFRAQLIDDDENRRTNDQGHRTAKCT
jgi:branched-subunit amino acid aminotransferase/4-amino-4-deoxychorismate lyase